MSRKAIAVVALLTLFGAASCGGIDAARDAGERAAGGAEEGVSKPEGATGSGARTPAASAGATVPEVTGSVEEAAQATVEEAAEPVLDEKWYLDSDGNYVPDFIEAANGFDPAKNDCAPEECPGAADGSSVEFVTSERNSLLILDSSGSMAADDGTGQTKMEAAKEALLRYAGPSSVLFETGFAVFGHEGDATRAGRADSCEEAAELLLPVGRVDPASFEETLSGFEPTGWTPIEGALREAEQAFAGKEGQVNRVTLVSDGVETCGGDPVAAAEELHRSGIELRVDVVGFGVPDDEAGQLRDIATAGGGEYFDAQTGADLDGYFQKQSEALSQTWDAFACELRNGLHDTICDQNQCNDATAFRIPEEQQRYEYDSPEYEALQDLSTRISAGLEERQKARDEASGRAQELQQQHSKLQDEYYRVFNEAYGG